MKWTDRALNKNDQKIDLYYSKVVPIDSKYIYLISGGLNHNFTQPSPLITGDSIFAIDFDQRIIIDEI